MVHYTCIYMYMCTSQWLQCTDEHKMLLRVYYMCMNAEHCGEWKRSELIERLPSYSLSTVNSAGEMQIDLFGDLQVTC